MKTDSELKRDVESELMWEPRVHEASLGVAVKEGIVTLSGKVPSYDEKCCADRAAEKEEAQQAAWAAPGVTTVQNELSVTP